jgi:hypothetical protein
MQLDLQFTKNREEKYVIGIHRTVDLGKAFFNYAEKEIIEFCFTF